MNISKITSDDPRLTAFALGELGAAERVAIAAAIKDDPAAQAFVEQIRALGGELSAMLAKEPLPVVRATAGVAAESTENKTATPVRDDYERRKMVRFPYYIVAGLAAACFAVLFVQQQTLATKRQEIAKAEQQRRNVERAASRMALPYAAQAGSPSILEVSLGDDAHAVSMPAFSNSPTSPPSVPVQIAGQASNIEAYAYQADNAYLAVAEAPLSTFSMEVDTAGYSNLRRFLKGGQRPPREAVRIEELVNYFPYRYTVPKDAATPFAASMEVASAPWNPSHRLVRIGLKGRELSLAERPALADQLSGTRVTIAKDVKLQVEFNPARVKSYRLIGYENRMLKKEDFNNDKIDAGEIGAGHTVTALYEVVPVGVDSPTEAVPAGDALKYSEGKAGKFPESAELLTLKVRYKAPTSDVSSKLVFPLVDSGAEFATASQDFKFAAAVASFGMMLRDSPHKGAVTFDSVLGWAEDGLGEDAGGYRHEFMSLVKQAKACSG